MDTIFKLLLLSLLITGCGFDSDESDGGGLVVGHQTVDDAFALAAPNNGTYKETENLNFVLSHPKDITVDTAGGTPSIDISIGENTRTATYVSGSGSTDLVFQYTVVAGEEDLDGISVDSTAIDLNGGTLQYSINGVLGDANTSIVYSADASEVLVDTGIPTLLTVTPPLDRTYRINEGLVFIATFDSPVVVVGTPRIQLDIGGTTRYANYYLGAGTSSLLFSYQVQSSDLDIDGIGVTGAIELTLGSITDFGGNTAVITFTAPDTTGVLVDGDAPFVTDLTEPADATYYSGQYISFSLDFNESVTVDTGGGTPRVAITVGATTRYATYYTGTGTTTLGFRYLVQSSDNDSNGIRIGDTIDENGGTIRDGSSNDAIPNIAPPLTPNVLVYGGNPSIVSVTPPADGDYVTGADLSFSVKFSEAVNITNSPSIDLTIGGNTRQATYAAGTTTDTIVFTYQAVVGDSDSDGIAFNSTSINLNTTGTIVSAITAIAADLDFSAVDPSLTGITVNQDVATQLVITTEPVDTTVSTNIPAITVEFRDGSNNLVASETSNVSVAIGTNPSGGILSGTTPVAAVGGVATFSDLQIDTVGNGYTLVFSSTGITGDTSVAFNITAAGATKLAFVQDPTDAVAGVDISPSITVEILDASDNRVTGATNTITLSFGTDASLNSDANLGGDIDIDAVSGLATFTDIDIDKIGTGYTLTATATGLTDDTSGTFNITPAAKSQLAFSVEPSNAEINVDIAPAIKVEIQDAFGNKTADTDLITLAINNDPPTGTTLGGDVDIAAIAGEATFTDIDLNQLGVGFTLDATAGGLTTATSASFDITTTPTKLVITQEPTNAYALADISPAITVEIQDASNNLVTSATDTVTLAFGTDPSTGPAIIGGTVNVAAVGGIATFSDIDIDEVQNGYTFTFTAAGLTSDTSDPFNITAAPPTKLLFNVQPSNTVAGANITAAIEVYITDANDNLVTTSTDTITLAFGTDASGGSATLGGDIDVDAVGGIATFSDININKAFTGYTLSATASGLTAATSTSFDITHSTATKLGFTVEPTSTTQNTNISAAIEISVLDAYDNVVTSASNSIALALNSNPGSSTLSGTTPQTASSGVATFSDIQLNNTGTGYTLDATTGGLTTATSASFDIFATPTQLAFGTQPADTALGGNLPSFTVEIHDASGNIVGNDTRAVTIAFENDPSGDSAALGGSTIVSAVAGVATFTGININEAYADYTFVATAAGLTSDTSTPFDITVAAPTNVTLNDPGSSPNADSTPEFTVDGVTSGDIVKLFTDSSCDTEVASFTSGGTSVNITTSTLAEGVYTIYANRSVSGNTSACSTAYEDYEVSGAFIELEQVGNGSYTYWANVGGDDRDWSTDTNDTGSNGVGPSAPQASTYYTYTEASNPVGASEEFILEYAAALNGTANDLAISFYWNKRGTDMGDLHFEASNDGGTTWGTLWSHTGADIPTDGVDVWRNQYVDICSGGYTSTNVLLRFRAVMPATGTVWNSDIGLDEMEVNAGGCQPGTPSTISIDSPSSNTVVGVTNMDAFTVSGACSDNGQNITLSGDVSGSTTCSAGAWSYVLDLSAHADGNIEVRVDHTSASGGANGSDTVTYTKDSVTIQFDDFELDLGNWTQDTGDNQDWTRNIGETPSNNVGPTDDQSGGGYYLYTEASNPTANSDEFIIESNSIDAGTYNVGIDFYWNKRGDNMGDLYLEVSTDGGTTWDAATWSHLGADVAGGGTDVWNNQTVDLCGAGYNSGNIMVRLRAVMPASGNRWNSDMGIDSIRFTTLGCP